MSAPKCAERVYPSGSWCGHDCTKTVKVERDGKWYCGIHDPVKVAEKRAERAAAARARMDEADRAYRRQKAIQKAERELIDMVMEIIPASLPSSIWQARLVLEAARSAVGQTERGEPR